MQNKYHQEILALIQENSGTPTQHTFLDSYLGNDHPRYSINAPTLRLIAKEWMKQNRNLSAPHFQKMLTSLIKGKSYTEKCMVGMLLDLSTNEQRQFDPACFDEWLNYLVGWAEVDSVCTGQYTITEIPAYWKTWSKLLIKFSKSKNINKRRASLALLCSPLRTHKDERLATLALASIEKLKHEKEILITKAISWLLRSMVKHHANLVRDYLEKNNSTLPAIAVRETLMKLKTGRKTVKL
jgi:3-methyladenine DNA glycosylase AlkD